MSSNPNNAVGTNAAYSGRTSVNAFNDDLAAYTSGVLSGWACVPSSGLTLALGGVSGTRDVAIAEDPAGNKTSINNISGSPISVTISAPPASNSRIDAIVAYVDNPPEGTSITADNPGACGLITVEGTAASTPVAPNESAIRTAITADGASGSTAYYVVLALVTVASGTTDITSDAIKAGSIAKLNENQITPRPNLVSFASNRAAKSDIGVGGIVNGTDLYFTGLDPSKKYLIEYKASVSLSAYSAAGTGAIQMAYSFNNSSWTNFGPASGATVRAPGDGADGTNLSLDTIVCFTGRNSIYLHSTVNSSNTSLRYGEFSGPVVAMLWEVTPNFVTNI